MSARVVGFGVALVVSLAGAGPAHAITASQVPDGLTLQQRQAVTNALLTDAGHTVQPYNLSQSAQAQALRDRIRTGVQAVPPGSAYEATHSAVTNTKTRSGLWPRFTSAVGGALRSRGAVVAMRAVPLAAGGYVLWQIGSGLTEKKVAIQLTPSFTADVSWAWSGQADTWASHLGDGGLSPSQLSGEFTNGVDGTLEPWEAPKFPPNSLVLRWKSASGSSWLVASNRDNGAANSNQTWSNQPNHNGGCCALPPHLPDLEIQNRLTVAHGSTANWHTIEIQNFNTPDRHTITRTHGSRGFYLDHGANLRAITAALTADPDGFSGVPSDDASRVKSPTLPDPGADPEPNVTEALREPDAGPLRELIAEAVNEEYPPATDGPLPDCRAMTLSECIAALEAAGFLTHHATVLEPAAADVTLPASAVVETVPAGGGANVDFDTDVEIRRNPGPDTMPRTLPPPNEGETGDAYRQRLIELGWPAEQVALQTASSIDVEKGPGVVTAVDPPPAVRVAPDASVTVTVNPSTAPVPGGGAPSCGLTAPTATLNLAPITSADLGDQFPLSLIGWLEDSLSGLVEAPAPPEVTFSAFGQEVGPFGFLDDFDGIIVLWRSVIAGFLLIGAAWFLWERTIGR